MQSAESLGEESNKDKELEVAPLEMLLDINGADGRTVEEVYNKVFREDVPRDEDDATHCTDQPIGNADVDLGTTHPSISTKTTRLDQNEAESKNEQGSCLLPQKNHSSEGGVCSAGCGGSL
jgi:hypothetical protein